jgi:hypothetical protein
MPESTQPSGKSVESQRIPIEKRWSPYIATLQDYIGFAINLSGGRANVKEILSVVNRMWPEVSDAFLKHELSQGVNQGRFRRSKNDTFSQGPALPMVRSNRANRGVIAGKKLLKVSPSSEVDLERAFVKNYGMILDGALYIPIRKLIGSRLGKIFDGVVIDAGDREGPRFWIVEFELASHGLESHIQSQVLGFIRALDDEKSLRRLVTTVNEYIEWGSLSEHDDGWAQDFFDRVQTKFQPRQLQPYEYVEKLIHDRIGIMIVIDEVKPDLKEVVAQLTKIRPVKIIEFQRYRGNGREIFTFSHNDMPSGHRRI